MNTANSRPIINSTDRETTLNKYESLLLFTPDAILEKNKEKGISQYECSKYRLSFVQLSYCKSKIRKSMKIDGPMFFGNLNYDEASSNNVSYKEDDTVLFILDEKHKVLKGKIEVIYPTKKEYLISYPPEDPKYFTLVHFDSISKKEFTSTNFLVEPKPVVHPPSKPMNKKRNEATKPTKLTKLTKPVKPVINLQFKQTDKLVDDLFIFIKSLILRTLNDGNCNDIESTILTCLDEKYREKPQIKDIIRIVRNFNAY